MKVESAIGHAAAMLKVGRHRIWVDPEGLERVKEAITKDDVRALIRDGVLKKRPARGQSRGRARALLEQKRRGRRRGKGSRRGTARARAGKKRAWVDRVRAQRRMLRELREKDPEAVAAAGYGKLYRMIKGNAFRGKKYVARRVEEAAKKAATQEKPK